MARCVCIYCDSHSIENRDHRLLKLPTVIFQMGRRRKTSSSAEAEKETVSSRRSQRTKEALMDQNSTDGTDEAEASAKASQRSSKGRTKRDSSNGDMEQEEAATNTRRLRRSSRSASVEKDKVCKVVIILHGIQPP